MPAAFTGCIIDFHGGGVSHRYPAWIEAESRRGAGGKDTLLEIDAAYFPPSTVAAFIRLRELGHRCCHSHYQWSQCTPQKCVNPQTATRILRDVRCFLESPTFGGKARVVADQYTVAARRRRRRVWQATTLEKTFSKPVFHSVCKRRC